MRSSRQEILDACRSTGQSDDGPNLEVLRSVAVEEGQIGSSRQESWLARIINKVVAVTRPLTQKQLGQGWITPGSIDEATGEPVPHVAARSSCSHCGTTETRYWREGPCGLSTLCENCGQRWVKAGKPGQQEQSEQKEAWIKPGSINPRTGELVSHVGPKSSCSQCGLTSPHKTKKNKKYWRAGPFGLFTLCDNCGNRWSRVTKQEQQEKQEKPQEQQEKPREQQEKQQLPQQQQQQQQEPYRRSSRARVKRKRDNDETED